MIAGMFLTSLSANDLNLAVALRLIWQFDTSAILSLAVSRNRCSK